MQSNMPPESGRKQKGSNLAGFSLCAKAIQSGRIQDGISVIFYLFHANYLAIRV